MKAELQPISTPQKITIKNQKPKRRTTTTILRLLPLHVDNAPGPDRFPTKLYKLYKLSNKIFPFYSVHSLNTVYLKALCLSVLLKL